MRKKVTVWSLNRASWLVRESEGWLRSALEGGLLSLLGGRRWQCDFGDRRKWNTVSGDKGGKRDLDSRDEPPAHQLMYEGEHCNEYFVPIPVKCLGMRGRDTDSLSGRARELLMGIVKERNCLREEELKKYWEEEGHTRLPGSRMYTAPYKGYYDILEENGPGNILIGYSQGGLVARYLAFLDEHVFQRNLIDGIITVQSPNWGSPLANDQNAESVVKGINELILTFLSLPQARYSKFHDAVGGQLKLKELLGLVEVLREELEESRPLGKNRRKARDVLITARKWLGGLEDNPFNAFYDLDVKNMERAQYSVLRLVNEHPLKRIHSAAIVGTNNDMEDFVVSFMNVFYRLGWLWLKNKRLLGSSIRESLINAGAVYRDEIMEEERYPTAEYVTQRHVRDTLNRYRNGFTVRGRGGHVKVGERRHDFVIPSASQILENGRNGGPLVINLVNRTAGHGSGGDPGRSAGRRNVSLVRKCLREFRSAMLSG